MVGGVIKPGRAYLSNRTVGNFINAGRRINKFKRESFINISKSLLEGEYIDCDNEIDILHRDMLKHWEQEHLVSPYA